MKIHMRNTFLEEMRKNPNIENACQKIGISRMTYYRWVEANPTFKKEVGLAMEHGIARVDDLTLSLFSQGIKTGDFKFLVYWTEKYADRLALRANKLQGKVETISLEDATKIAERNILEKMSSGDLSFSKFILENNDPRYLNSTKARINQENLLKAKGKDDGVIEKREVDKMLIMLSRFAGCESALDGLETVTRAEVEANGGIMPEKGFKSSKTEDQILSPNTPKSSAEPSNSPLPAV